MAGGALLVVLAATFWGGRASVGTVAEASRAEDDAPQDVVWQVSEESIGRALTFPGEVFAPVVPGALANVDGVITAITAEDGAPIDAGDVLFDVDLRPVVAGEGDVPAFRDLAEGALGADVAQLREFLCELGHLAECAGTYFDAELRRAAAAWQEELGVPADGAVRAPDIMWFPDLPVHIARAPGVAVGARVAVDDRPWSVAAGALRLESRLTGDQAELVPAGAPVRFGDEGAGVAFLRAGTAADGAADDGLDGGADGGVVLEVRADDGERGVCDVSPECRELIDGARSRPVELSVEIVPSQRGVGVPVRAVLTAADGQTYVVRRDGSRAAVTVTGSTGGIALVEGLAVGEAILVSPDEQ